uniref:Neprosin PEP catalytic domain-containing protein n=1 Tax=Brassica oleracea var. oleracea TaxID=109376 RepID=A0A0D2ZUZ5_BRAOL
MYQEHQPRSFTFWIWTTSITIALEAAITRTYTFEGPQFEITIQISKDQSSGNWWLGLGRNMVLVGYWPAAIFTSLSDHALNVEWGRRSSIPKQYWHDTIVHMGSVNIAEKDFRKAGYVCDIYSFSLRC